MTVADLLPYGAAAGASYFAGSIPFGLLTGYLFVGVDIRKIGSGNIGATNAARAVGRGRKRLGFAVFLLVFILDGLKGAGPVLLSGALCPAGADPVYLSLAAGAGAVTGHMFSLFLRFRGGKGVAVGAGVMSALLPVPTLVAFGLFLLVLALGRMVSLGSVLAALSLPGGVILFYGGEPWAVMAPRLIFTALVATVVVIRHRSNLMRIARGTEHRLGQGMKKSGVEEGTP